MKFRKFVDLASLYASGGAGGNGVCSFRREKSIPRGGPDGGDGGRGGSVILKADPNENSLIGIFYAPHQRAGHGEHGKGKQMYGQAGADRILPVPCGTVVRDKETGLILGEVLEAGAEMIVAHGGRGGLGNMHWKTSTNRAPREHTPGEPGEELTLRLELKLMADAGLVGFPNAGKSSLLTRLTSAHPKIASYPFTTLNPIVGTMIFEDYSRLTVADIPGLIDGSHSGIGLGDAFLRHIERCSLLIYVIDMAGSEDRHPARDYLALTKELQLYAEDLPDRPSLIVANKMDLPGADRLLSEFFEETGKKPIPVSALTGEGIDRLKTSLFKLWQQKNRPRRRKASVRDPV